MADVPIDMHPHCVDICTDFSWPREHCFQDIRALSESSALYDPTRLQISELNDFLLCLLGQLCV
jgi:hypothetical protein